MELHLMKSFDQTRFTLAMSAPLDVIKYSSRNSKLIEDFYRLCEFRIYKGIKGFDLLWYPDIVKKIPIVEFNLYTLANQKDIVISYDFLKLTEELSLAYFEINGETNWWDNKKIFYLYQYLPGKYIRVDKDHKVIDMAEESIKIMKELEKL